jgi:putative Holliday junction resolvase
VKVLSLDLGLAWVGIAISSRERKYAFPLKTVKTVALTLELLKIVKEEEVSVIVFGLPFTLRGDIGSQSKKVLEQVENLKKNEKLSALKWVSMDERFSSQGALNVLHDQNKKIGNNKEKEHSIVAALLLQSYLDANTTFSNNE